MHEQNFERQVRQKMDELSLVPSPPVWDGIEGQIRAKKEKRRILFWILPLIVVGLLATWFLLQKPNSTASTRTQPNAEPGQATPLDGKENINGAPIQKERKKSREVPIDAFENNLVQDQQPEKDPGSIAKQTAGRQKLAREQKFKVNSNKPTSGRGHQLAPDPSPQSDTTAVKAMRELSKDVAADLRQPVQSTAPHPLADTSAPTSKLPPIDTLSATSDSAVVSPKPKPEKKKALEVGIMIAFGSSGVTTGLLDGLGEKAMSDFNGLPIQNSSGGVPPPPPSKIRRGTFYAVGATANYRVSSRASLSAGLQYQRMNTEINVGARGDTSIPGLGSGTNYFDNRSNSPRRNYTNAYHFLSLPVSYQYQLHKKLPLYLSAGASFSRLLSTNALHYSSSSNVYYSDSSAMRKNAAGLFTSLTYDLKFKKSFRVEVGPAFRYNLTSTSRAAGTKPQHLYTLGLKSIFKFR